MGAAPLLIKLQVNTTGAWRDVLLFDFATIDTVMAQAPQLFALAFDRSASGLSLRVIETGEVAPVATWKATTGWSMWTR